VGSRPCSVDGAVADGVDGGHREVRDDDGDGGLTAVRHPRWPGPSRPSH